MQKRITYDYFWCCTYTYARHCTMHILNDIKLPSVFFFFKKLKLIQVDGSGSNSQRKNIRSWHWRMISVYDKPCHCYADFKQLQKDANGRLEWKTNHPVDLIKLSQTWKGYNPCCVCMTLLSGLIFIFWWYQVENNVVSHTFSFRKLILHTHALTHKFHFFLLLCVRCVCVAWFVLCLFCFVISSLQIHETNYNSCGGHSIWHNEKWHVCWATALAVTVRIGFIIPNSKSCCNCFWKSKLFFTRLLFNDDCFFLCRNYFVVMPWLWVWTSSLSL